LAFRAQGQGYNPHPIPSAWLSGLFDFFLEPSALLLRVIKFRIGIPDFHTGNKKFKTF